MTLTFFRPVKNNDLEKLCDGRVCVFYPHACTRTRAGGNGTGTYGYHVPEADRRASASISFRNASVGFFVRKNRLISRRQIRPERRLRRIIHGFSDVRYRRKNSRIYHLSNIFARCFAKYNKIYVVSTQLSDFSDSTYRFNSEFR